MQDYNVSVILPNEEIVEMIANEEMTLSQIATEYQDKFEDDIILAKFDGKLRELGKKVDRDGSLSFITVSQKDGKRTYRRSVLLMLQKAIQILYGSESMLRIMHSLGEGYYCEIVASEDYANPCGYSCESFTDAKKRIVIDDQEINRIKTCMETISEQNSPIVKHSVKTEWAEEYFLQKGMPDKARLFHFRRSSRVNLYNLDGVEAYFYGFMAPSTGMLKYYNFEKFENGFVILFPGNESKKVEGLSTSQKLFNTLHDSRTWSKMLGIGSIGQLNEAITKGRGQEIILLQEALMEQKIGQIAEQIVSDRDKKFIMIAGPSSSGKTSFANRLSIQLTAKGLNPHPVSLDDYYLDREHCPRNPDGSYDFECLESLDVEQFNLDMKALLSGETVDMPAFNFKSGKREYRGNYLTLKEDDVLVIEGIHGLNSKMSHMLPDESKFKIYISALTQLNMDEHNPLPTTDCRLLRRMVRDARTRNTSARETIAMWPSVRRGEEKYIFPFQEGADVMFNSALVYELAVLKVHAEPLLFNIPKDCDEYLEAKRLLKLLDYFLPLPVEGINKNSLMREFVGGSCFNV